MSNRLDGFGTHKNILFGLFCFTLVSLSLIHAILPAYCKKKISFIWFRNDNYRLDVILFFCSELKQRYHKNITATCSAALGEM